MYNQLKYIKINIVRQLPKEVNKAVIKNTITIKGETYTVSKAYKKILEKILNKITD